MYLKKFEFAPIEKEEQFTHWNIQRTCYDTCYPFGILSKKGLRQVDFEPITIFYGSNGCGKSTALNIIAEKIRIERGTLYNRSNFFEDYLDFCDFESTTIPRESRIITSDDVFDFMLNLRSLNEGVDLKREELLEEYMNDKYSTFQMKSIDDYEELKRRNLAKRKTQSQYIRSKLKDNVREHSNGESAFMYFVNMIKENALYILDEPENSMSTDNQMELMKLVQDSARFFNCQFIIATHSPFLLAMDYCKIYDFDENPVDVKKWTELKNVRVYYDFFKAHEREF